MKNFSLFGWLLLLTILCTAITCADHRDQPALRYRLKTVAHTYPLPDPYTPYTREFTLIYNAKGQLESYIRPGNRQYSPVYENGRISSVTIKVDDFVFHTTRYKYDAQGRVSSITLYVDKIKTKSEDKVVSIYNYEGNNTLPSSQTVTRFENMISIGSRTETYAFAGGNATTINGTSYSYDNTPNPYRGLLGFSIYYSLSNDYESPSDGTANALNRPFNIGEAFADQSVKVFNQNNRTTGAQLTYNSNGLVSKIAYDNGNIEEFTYETY
ncbi:hypothetical protein [Fibrella aquatilis]|uniref:YD repeat-containing protein n=1 Tax=Fibrella aquatilis TaxID=2817059 RepID=A0A939G548_9BACT|nr:hypothetical protein [Fibrella aquatilis]MBO0930809.1 hypothetical protein [Fibrella aquatilis]